MVFKLLCNPYLIVAWQQMNFCIASRNLHLTVLTNGFYCRISTKPPSQIQRDGIFGDTTISRHTRQLQPFSEGRGIPGKSKPKVPWFQNVYFAINGSDIFKACITIHRKKLSRRNISKSTLYLKFTTPNCNYWMKLVMMEWCENIVTHCNKKQ